MHFIWLLSLKLRTSPFQGEDAPFKSHKSHRDHSIMVSTADCGLADAGSIPAAHLLFAWPSGRNRMTLIDKNICSAYTILKKIL